jgi:hypothetical protein
LKQGALCIATDVLAALPLGLFLRFFIMYSLQKKQGKRTNA